MEDKVAFLLFFISVFVSAIWTLPLEGKTTKHCSASGIAIYKLTFQTYWSSEKFSKQYPTYRPHAQWSKLIGRTHNQDYVLWHAGELASNGMRQMAQDGTSDDLDQEHQGYNGVFDMFSSSRIENGVGQTTTNIFVDGKHHMVSLVSHLTPSPDWFVGIDSVSLCNGDKWEATKHVVLSIWDAGTDKGYTFTSPHWPEVPSKAIEEITASHPKNLACSFYYPKLTQLPTIASVVLTRESISEAGHLQRDWTALKGELMSNSTKLSNPAEGRPVPTGKPKGGATSVRVLQGANANSVPEAEPLAPQRSPVGRKETSKAGKQGMKKPKLTREERRRRKLERQNRRNKKRKNKKSKSKKQSSLVSQRLRDVDCQASEWLEWSPCSKTCGYGTHTRMRTVQVTSSGNGAPCPPLTEDGMCGSMRGCGWSHFNTNNWEAMGR